MASDTELVAWADELLAMDRDIDTLQGAKRSFFATIRETEGKRTADAIKAAVRRHRMDSDKAAEAEAVDAETERILGLIRAPRAPRATRVASAVPVPAHDPETGEINEPESTTRIPNVSGAFDAKTRDLGTTPDHPPIQAETPNEREARGSVAAAGESPAIPSQAANVGGELENAADEPDPVIARRRRHLDDVQEHSADEVEVRTRPVNQLAEEPGRSLASADKPSVVPFVAKAAPFRPYCLKPQMCGGMGRQHCYSCQKAHDAAQSEAGAA